MSPAAVLERAETGMADGAEAVRLRLAERLHGEIDPAVILATTAEEVGRHLGVSRCGYGEIDIDNGLIVIPVDWADGVPSLVGRHALSLDAIFVRGEAAGQTGIMEDTAAAVLPPRLRDLFKAMKCRAFIAAPLLHEGRLVGLFSVQSRDARAWTPAEIELVERTAAMTWSALTHAQTGARLRESEESFRLLAENIPGICWLAGASGRVYWVNEIGRRFFGDLGGAVADARAVVHPDDYETARGLWARTRETGEPLEAVLRMRGADQSYRPFMVRIAPIHDAAGAVVRWCGVQIDLTDSRAQDRRQSLLRAFGDRTRDEDDAADILTAAAAALIEHLGIDEMAFAEQAEGSGVTVQRYGAGGERIGDEELAGDGAALLGVAHRDGEPLIVDDWSALRSNASERAGPAARTVGASLNRPISVDGKVVAVMSAQSHAPRRWLAEEIELCGELADRLCAALSRARAEAALLERDRSQAFLIDWNDELRQVETPDEIMGMTLETLGRHLNATRVTYAEIDASGRVFTTRWNWLNGCDSLVGVQVFLDRIGPKLENEWLQGAIVRYDDVTHDPTVSDRDRAIYVDRHIAAFVSIPLVRRSAVKAILSVQCDRPRRWRDAEVGLIRDVGERTWAVLERARAQEELRDRDRNQAFLIAWSDRIRHETSPGAILGATLAMVGEQFGLTRAAYAEADVPGDALKVVQEWRRGDVGAFGPRFALSVLGERVVAAHLTESAVIVRSIDADDRFDDGNRPHFVEADVAAFVSLPMVRSGALLGVLSAQSDVARDWTAAEVQLLRDLADRTWAVLERARSEERMEDTEALLDAFMHNAPFGMYLKDADGPILRVNPELERQLGRPAAQLVGHGPSDFFSAPAARRLAEQEQRALAGEIVSDEFEAPDRTGYTDLLSVMFPIPGARGVARIGGFTVDLTARKEAEAALQQSRDALHQSEKLTALGSLLAGVSHELNNPLSIVVAQAVMMERQAKGGDLAERAFKIRKAADRCARIVQTFLAMARQKEPERAAVDLNAVVDAALDLAGYGLRSDGVIIEFRRDPALPTIAADADQLHQIIVNLLVNAQHAMARIDGVRSLTIVTGPGPEPQTVVLDVTDTGPGVPEAEARRIFEPFYTTKVQGEGTGLGLSFSQGLAEAHGGRLALVPSDRGARFRLTLPVNAGQVLSPIAPAPEPVALDAPRRRALLIDDEGEIAESLADFLSLEGFDSDIATSGEEGCARMEAGGYDLIVSDLRMPGMDGPALHAWVRERRPALADRIGFVTGDTLGAPVARFLAGAERPVLEKPFTPDTVRRFLGEMAQVDA